MTRTRDGAGDVGPELAAELLSRGHQVVLRARGTSMGPLVRDGDVLQLAPLDRTPAAGDLVAALSAGRLLVHRVARVRGSKAELRGDALWNTDGWFAFKRFENPGGDQPAEPRLIGRAIALRRGVRTLGEWRFSGRAARVWTAALPLVRLCRGAARRSVDLPARAR